MALLAVAACKEPDRSAVPIVPKNKGPLEAHQVIWHEEIDGQWMIARAERAVLESDGKTIRFHDVIFQYSKLELQAEVAVLDLDRNHLKAARATVRRPPFSFWGNHVELDLQNRAFRSWGVRATLDLQHRQRPVRQLQRE
jgi:hypothetical protein